MKEPDEVEMLKQIAMEFLKSTNGVLDIISIMCQFSEEGLVSCNDFNESVNKQLEKLTNSATLQEFEEEMQNN